MSFISPISPIPVIIYSTKAVFNTEEVSSSVAVVSGYTFSYKKSSDSTYIDFLLDSSVRTIFLEPIEPSTSYDVRWTIRGTADGDSVETSYSSEVYTFYSRPVERWKLRPAIPFPLVGADFTGALQGEIDALNSYINTNYDEEAMARLSKEGAGRIVDSLSVNGGCRLSKNPASTMLYLSNGSFQSGPNFSSSDPNLKSFWFPGARIFYIKNILGKVTLEDDSALDISVDGTFYGYMGAYIDDTNTVKYVINWKSTLDVPRQNGSWLIGKVIVKDGVITTVDDTIADIITSLLSISQQLKTVQSLVGVGDEADTAPKAKLQLDFVNSSDIAIAYDTVGSWVDVPTANNVPIEMEQSLAVASVSGSIFFQPTAVEMGKSYTRIILDAGTSVERIFNLSSSAYGSSQAVGTEPTPIQKVNALEGSGAVFFDNLSKSTHSVKLQVMSDKVGVFLATAAGLRIQVTELGVTADAITPLDGRKIIFDPLSTPPQTIYDYVTNEDNDILETMDNRISQLEPGQTTQLDFLVGQNTRFMIGRAQDKPSDLLRLEGSFIAGSKIGQSGVQITLDSGEQVGSPVYEGQGTLLYYVDTNDWKL